MANLPNSSSSNHKIFTNLLMIANIIEIRKLKFANPFKSMNWIILSQLAKLTTMHTLSCRVICKVWEPSAVNSQMRE